MASKAKNRRTGRTERLDAIGSASARGKATSKVKPGVAQDRPRASVRTKKAPSASSAAAAQRPRAAQKRGGSGFAPNGSAQSGFAPSLDESGLDVSGLGVSGLDVSVDSALGARPVCAPSQGEGAASEPRAAKDMHAGKAKRQAAAAGTQEKAKTSASHLDFDALAANLGRLADEATRAAHAYIAPRLGGDGSPLASAEVAEISRTLGEVAERWLGEPQRAVEAQARLTSGLIGLWADALRRFKGEEVPPAEPPDASDRRFGIRPGRRIPSSISCASPMSTRQNGPRTWCLKPRISIPTRATRRSSTCASSLAALSPSNFVALNPELIRETLRAERGQSGARCANARRGRGSRRRRAEAAPDRSRDV